MTGYQEILTDPSYAGQIITFTFPHIGNVGTNPEDNESRKPHAHGLIIREPINEPSNFRNKYHLDHWLVEKGLTGICGIDTRAITRYVRLKGPQNVAIIYPEEDTDAPIEKVAQELNDTPGLSGMELARNASGSEKHEWNTKRWQLDKGFGTQEDVEFHVVAIDYGQKLNILRCLVSSACRVTVVRADTSASEILALKPDGVFLSNGPGDPAATATYAVPIIKELLAESIPIFGICLGHQLLALALGAKTEKMHQGHRGANHPVRRVSDNVVEITSQNHGFVVCHNNIPTNVEVTHLSLFDGTVEGIRHKEKPAFSVQYHPESSPGPHDSMYLFDEFVELMRKHAT